MDFKVKNITGKRGRAGKEAKMVKEMMRYLLKQPVGAKGELGRPRKMTALQSGCRTLINQMIRGDVVAAEIVFSRADGRIPAAEIANLWDAPDADEQKGEDISRKEVARIVGTLLLTHQTIDAEPVEN